MNSLYITEKSPGRARPSRRRGRLTIFLSALTVIFLGFFSFNFISPQSVAKNSKADGITQFAANPVQYTMCNILNGKGSPFPSIYQWANSSDLQFYFFSKSAVSSGTDNVDNGFLNGILESVEGLETSKGSLEALRIAAGFPANDTSVSNLFRLRNDAVIGTDIDGALPSSATKFNGGISVDPFSLWGVAGLDFTGYLGEWDHVVVNACNPSAPASDYQTEAFYTNRLYPLTTWANISTSSDPRTEQFDGSFAARFILAAQIQIANIIFDITKFLVVIAVAFISLTFTNVSQALGLTTAVAGSGSSPGLYRLLYHGLFLGLIAIVFAGTAVHIFWSGVVKRQLRQSMVDLARSIALFIAAAVIAAAPGFWVSLPNDVSVIGEALVANALNRNLPTGDGTLCKSGVGKEALLSPNKLGNKYTLGNVTSLQQLLDASDISITSSVGCNLWDALLLKPYLEGQFGVLSLSDLNQSAVKNDNSLWVDPTDIATTPHEDGPYVPLGGGASEHNWALFQISSLTNAHSPLGSPGEESTYSQGVANDWWRIVDAFSNYNEAIPGCSTTISTSCELDKSSITSGANSSTLLKRGASNGGAPLSFWNTWVGDNTGGRVYAAATSTLIAAAAVAAPIAFSGISIVFALGITILMAFAPIFLLLGCWAGRGWEIFKAWADLLINTTMKRIGTGILVIVSIALVDTILSATSHLSYFQELLLLIIMSWGLWKSRQKIFSMLAFARYSSHDFGGTLQRIQGITKNISTSAGNVTLGGAAGGIASSARGGSFRGGAMAGMNNELQNLSYRTRMGRNIRMTYDRNKMSADETAENATLEALGQTCYDCGKSLSAESPNANQKGYTGEVYMDPESGELLCKDCYKKGDFPDATYLMTVSDRKPRADRDKNLEKSIYDAQSFAEARAIVTGLDREGEPITSSKAEKLRSLTQLMEATLEEVDKIKYRKKLRDAAHEKRQREETLKFNLPDEIIPYIDMDTFRLAVDNDEFEYARLALAGAWIAHIRNNKDSNLAELIEENPEEISKILTTLQGEAKTDWTIRQHAEEESKRRDKG